MFHRAFALASACVRRSMIFLIALAYISISVLSHTHNLSERVAIIVLSQRHDFGRSSNIVLSKKQDRPVALA